MGVWDGRRHDVAGRYLHPWIWRRRAGQRVFSDPRTSVSQSEFPDDPIPKKKGIRVAFSGLQILVQPIGPNAVRSCLVASVDQKNNAMPEWLSNVVIKYLLGVLFYLQARCA